MAKYKIAILPGDGIGKEVIESAMIVLEALKFDAEYIYGDIGWEFWCREGNPLPERTLNLLRSTNACLFGAITSKPKQEAEEELSPSLKGKGYSYTSPIVRLRQEFNLHTNLRPCKSYSGNPLNYRENIDIVVFRENTEDLYSGVEFHPVPLEVAECLEKNHPKMKRFSKVPPDEMAISVRINTKSASSNIVKQAFEYARKYGYKSVTIVEKPNVLRETSGLVVRCAREVAKNYPEIKLNEANIDAMCMWLIKNPLDYGVLVSSNMFGDIISDLCGQLVGGLGFAPGANIGDNYGVFEPVHGSAPKYCGMYKVNPIATILASKLMLMWLGEEKDAKRIDNAVRKVIAEGRVRTYDMGGNATTLDMAKEIASKV